MPLQTGNGVWDPLVWTGAFLIILAIVLLIRVFGMKTKAKTGTVQAEQFFSGNEPPKSGSIRASNVYWGFFESTKGYYKLAKKMHSGIVNEYVFWLVFVAIVLLAIILLEGLASG